MTMTFLTASFILSVMYLQALSLPTSRDTELDVDEGKDRDIFDINQDAGLDLVEGDIVFDQKQGRNSIIGEEYRWPTVIPYYLEDSVEINAKGVILKAFEQYRLKTCIDFKPWEGETNYISVFKGNGCFSSVGNQRVGKQQLSIGSNCDRIATIEHEFLHALGFWHEQSRSDRGDYVTIVWNDIIPGKEHNFNTYNDSVSSALNVPYDYTSVMHYSNMAFSNDSSPTIITKIPAFMDVIGQRMEFSDSDLLKLNRLYNCTTSLTFMDTCSFELENICGMIQGPKASTVWTRETTASGGPSTDYSNMGQCTGTGHFMHFNTTSGQAGDKALLETRLLYPRRGRQCLQFFLYHSGHSSDSLNIWVREYDAAHPNGTLRFIQTVEAQPEGLWQLQHVNLNTSRKFRVVFEGVKGDGPSSGGFSVDDINLSETECPEYVWRVRDFEQLMDTTPMDEKLCSPRFTSKEGYTFQVCLYPNGTKNNPGHLGMYIHLASGPRDSELTWPCPWKQTTVMLMDQNPDIRRRMNNQRSITMNPTEIAQDNNNNTIFFWDDPSKVGEKITGEDGISYFRGKGQGTSVYLTHPRVKSRNFIKGKDALFLLTMEDVSHLLETQTTPTPSQTEVPTQTPTHESSQSTTQGSTQGSTQNSASTVSVPTDPCSEVHCENDGVCVVDKDQPVCRCAVGNDWWYMGDRCQRKGSSRDATATAVGASIGVLAAMLVVTAVSVVYVRKKYKKKLHEQEQDIVLQNKTAT